MTACLICLRPTPGAKEYHPACARALFGTDAVPSLNYELGELYAVASQMAGKMSMSGIQEKVSLKLSTDKSRLEVAETGGRYILKPEPARYSALPQNEHVSMIMARLAGVEIPPCGLIRLKDGSLTYIIKRFDRTDSGDKLRVEDFCQLSKKPIREKYEGSAELCVRLLRQFASEPGIEIGKIYRLLLFGWWISNGDMHLKNFSLITEQDGIRRLSPAYDLLCTRLAIPDDDSLALTMGGRNKRFSRKKWLEFGRNCEIPDKAVGRFISSQIKAVKRSAEMIRRSYLPDTKKDQYRAIISENTVILEADQQ